MFKIFLQNEFRSFERSSLFEQRLVVRILISIGLALAIIQFGAIGFLLAHIFETVTSETFAILFISFHLVDLMLKLMFLKPPSGLLYSYLALPIPKRNLVAYSMIKLPIHFTSLAILFFWVPFLLEVMGLNLQFITWISLVLVSINANALFVYLIKTSMRKALWVLAVLSALVLSLYFLDRVQVLDVFALFAHYFNAELLVEKLSINLAAVSVMLLILFFLIRGELYYQTAVPAQGISRRTRKNSFDVAYEWKLLWRNSRYRNTFLFNTFLLGGNMVLQTINISRGKSEVVESTFIMSGIFIWLLASGMGFGQLFFKTESCFLAKYLSLPINMVKMLNNKFYFSALMLTLSALLISPIVFYYPGAWKYIVCSLLFHIGYTTYIFLYRGTFNKTLFEINGKTLFNYQGADFTFHFPDILLFANLLLVPLFFYLSSLIGMGDIFLILLGSGGLISMALDKKWKKLIMANFQKRKYLMYSGILEK